MRVRIRRIAEKEKEQVVIECVEVTSQVEDIYAYHDRGHGASRKLFLWKLGAVYSAYDPYAYFRDCTDLLRGLSGHVAQ